jgi:hypothetical protein
MNRPKVLATGLLVAVFVAGIAVGGAGSAWAGRNADPDADTTRPTYVERLETNLGLTEAQRIGVEEALEQYNDALHEFWKQTRTEKDSIGRITRGEITGLLDGEQQVSYAEMNARIDSVRAERRRQHDEEHEQKKRQ